MSSAFFSWLLAPFLAAAVVSCGVALGWYRIVKRIGVVRFPGGRHLHPQPTLLWGGVAMGAVCIAMVVARRDVVLTPQVLALLSGMVLLIVIGALDDLFNFGWRVQLTAQVSAGIFLVMGGAVLEYLNLPFGGALSLGAVRFPAPPWWCATPPCTVPVLGSLVTVFFVVAVINAVNWFDGTDGAAIVVSGVALFTIGALSLRPEVMQPVLAIIAALAAGAAWGFLPLNVPPARQFLGTAGSTVLGFMVAGLSVLAGAKLATVALVLALPACDMLFVVMSRFASGRPIVHGDTRHLHHWLMRQKGWSRRKILILFFLTSTLLMFPAVWLPHPAKAITLAVAALFIFAAFFLYKRPLRTVDNPS